MSWKVLIKTTSCGNEIVSMFLYDMGAMGVSIQDPNDLKDLLQHKLDTYWDYIDDELLHQDDEVVVCGFFEDKLDDAAIAHLVEQLDNAKQCMPVDMGTLALEMVEDTTDGDWFDNWKQFYHPIPVGDITVLPAWQEDVPDGIVVRINPSIAFGSGEHESTRMCLALMQKLDLAHKQVADIGCGSGILGIAMLKLGARHCYFADIDGDAMRNMQENAALNDVTNYTQQTAPLTQGCPVVADVMCANITADILIMLSHEVLPYLCEHGYLIVSGIIAAREQEVLDAFERVGLESIDSLQMGDWRAHLMQRK